MPSPTSQVQKRSALYVDGFNLYHPINDMGEAFLKWASLWKLGKILSEPSGLTLVKVVLCTAVPTDNPGKRDRHTTFNAAQRARGVEVILGHHVVEGISGKRAEKQSDINLALSVILDGLDDVYDTAFLLSADSDQAATGRIFSKRLESKNLISVAPPGRSPPEKLRPFCIKSITLTKHHLECCVMPEMVEGKTGKPITRPASYAPPANWVHPDQRPRGKPSKPPKKWSVGFRA